MTLVGREGELDGPVDLLRVRSRLPLLAAVSGPAGIGKTAIWLAATEEARSLGTGFSSPGRPRPRRASRSRGSPSLEAVAEASWRAGLDGARIVRVVE